MYGYSLIYFLPASILAMFPSSLWQYLCFLAAFGLNCLFFLKNLPLAVNLSNENVRMVVLGFAGVINLMLALTMKCKFYTS